MSLLNKTEIARIKRSIRKLKKCGGNCKECSNAEIKTSSNSMFYAFYCSVDKNIQPLTNTYKTLHSETLEALQFELI